MKKSSTKIWFWDSPRDPELLETGPFNESINKCLDWAHGMLGSPLKAGKQYYLAALEMGVYLVDLGVEDKYLIVDATKTGDYVETHKREFRRPKRHIQNKFIRDLLDYYYPMLALIVKGGWHDLKCILGWVRS